MIARLRLVKTCGGCPEQYDVFLGDDCIGYMRLRHGSFRAEYKNNVVYTASPHGDGCFHEDERVKFLNAACRAILDAYNNHPEETVPIYDLAVSDDL